jgi:hypothetical protein
MPETCRRVFTLIFIMSAMTVLPPRLGSEEVSPPAVVMQVEGGKIHITPPNEQLKVSSQDLLEWVRSAAGAVAHCYGHFPVSHLTLQIRASRHNGVTHGVTYAKGGGSITIAVGPGTESNALKNDWVLTHEMIHLAFPSMAKKFTGLKKGFQPTLSRWPERKWASFRWLGCGSSSSLTCPKDSLPPATEVWT